MRISLREAFRRRRTAGRSRRSRKQAIKHAAACLTLGLATAWGGDADAAIIKVSVTPEQTLTDVFCVFYHNNSSGGIQRSLGTLDGGLTTEFFFDFPNADPNDFVGSFLGYNLMGLYDEDGAPGAALSFPDGSPITNGDEWGDVFHSTTEAGAIDRMQIGRVEAWVNTHRFTYGFLADYGNEATIILFSEATYGGVVTATVVPEPATFALLVTGAGIITLRTGRRPD